MSATTDPHGRIPADELLLLQAALAEGERARAAWHELRAAHDWLDHLAGPAYGLLPQLHRNLSAIEPDGSLLGRLAGVHRRTWFANQSVLAAAGDAIRIIDRARPNTLLLGTGAVTATVLGDLGARPLDCIELAVPTADMSDALRALQAEGWAVCPSPHARHRTVHALERGNANLRLRQFRRRWPTGAGEDLWDQAIPTSLAGTTVRTPGLADQILLICGRASTRWAAPLRWIPDAALILRGRGGEIDVERMAARARRWRVSLDAADALDLIAGSLELDSAERAAHALRRRSPDVGERIARRVSAARGVRR